MSTRGSRLELFSPDGTPKPKLALVMANMARVEIGPLGSMPELIAAGSSPPSAGALTRQTQRAFRTLDK